jgi:catalase
MDEPSIAKQLVDATASDFPDHDPKRRPVHTIGIGVDGYFEPSDVAQNYCIAEHFQGPRVPVLVRFSNGSGSPVQHDGWSDARGMATRFFLRDQAATDLIAMTLTEFFVPTVDDFLAFTKAAVPKPAHPEPPWQKMFDMLQLKKPLDDPYPGQSTRNDAGTLDYANHHRFAQLAVFQASLIGAPVSYARATYHAVHTFVAIAPDRVRRHVRFGWQPVAGVRNTKTDATPVDDYLHQELRERLEQLPARFMLMMTIGEAGDAFDDPTVPWPDKRIRVVMGTLTLTGVAADQPASAERISFNPWRLLPGLEPSNDPILEARRDAYEESRHRRGGTPCPFNRS